MWQHRRGIRLTGGIGSGKSTASGMLAALGGTVISADEAAHRVLERDGGAFDSVARRWPRALVAGEIDRRLLGEMVFGDSAALRELEALTHPHIREIIVSHVADADAVLVILEIPLLRDPLGLGWPVVVVDAPVAVRISRLEARGMSIGEIEKRMAAQPGRDEWLAAADYVIDNGSDLEGLSAECRRLWEQLLAA
jgi:dephospho-CoA kinase